MKIAYLLLLHTNPLHAKRLLKALENKDVDFFIHVDKKSSIAFDFPKKENISIIKNPIPVYWGGFSLVEATLLLIKAAKEKRTYDYYVLLSGSDYPIRSNAYIQTFLEKNKGKACINMCEMPKNDKGFDRVVCFYNEGTNNKFLNAYFSLINQMVRYVGTKRKYPKQYKEFTLYAGSQWWLLPDTTIVYILDFITHNPAFVEYYKHTYIPDEMFFQTILGNSLYKKDIVNACTYADWNPDKRPLPAIITEEYLSVLSKDFLKTVYGDKQFSPLFARKFTDASESVIEHIEKKMRS